MTVNDVIDAVRVRLGDTSQERWSTNQLMLYTTLAQNTICSITHFYRKDDWITLVDGQLIYDLPADCLVLNRIEYAGEFFPIESRNAIDRGEAQLPCALKDNLPYNKLEIVLSVDRSDLTLFKALESTYGVVVASDSDGVDTSATPLDDIYGVVSNIDTPPTQPEVVTNALHVYYSAIPPKLRALEDVLVLPDVYFNAFFHYVTGMALQDDNDANNIQRGEMELQKFERVLADIYKKSAKDYTSNVKSKLVTPRRI